MKLRKIIYTAFAAVDVVSVIAWGILTAVGHGTAAKQVWNERAAQWDADGGSAQISCYLTEDSGFSTNMVGGVKAELMSELKNISITPEEGQELVLEAYSASAGKMHVRCDGMGHNDAEITAVGGDFFMFRDFQLIDGSYFGKDDIMQDGAVIDRSLAWALYGSAQVSGMNIYINGTKYYIAGVIEDPQTKYDRKTAGETPRAYLSYEGVNLMESMHAETGFTKITAYECISPNPVEKYAYNAVTKYFDGAYKDRFTIVDNSERFEPSVRAKAYKSLEELAISDKPLIFPYWENSSRMAEFRLARVYHLRRLTYIAPVLTLLWSIVALYRLLKRTRRQLTDKTADTITKLIYNHKQKKIAEKEGNPV